MSRQRLLTWLVTASLSVAAWSPAAARAGTLDLMPSGDWVQALPDSEMAELRGGFRGIAFSAFMTTTVENMTADLNGTLDTSATPPSFSVSDGQVNIQTVLGTFIGTTGIFQIAQVPGNFNIVNQNLFVQIVIGELQVSAPSVFGF